MGELTPLPLSFYRRPADEVARDLIGRWVVRRLDGRRSVLRIVETEAYLGEIDRASHAWGGRRTERTAALYRDGGRAYVYLVYGMHHLLNAVTGERCDGTAVLLRAGEAIEGAAIMARRRGLASALRPGQLAGGPAKLTQALAVDLALNGASLRQGELTVTAGRPVEPGAVATGARIGVDYAGDHASWPLRFAEAGNPEVSRPWPWRG
ncbi:MAG: DNA-3-methyladenine glycosylase [Thermoanaerobaculia bacterium]